MIQVKEVVVILVCAVILYYCAVIIITIIKNSTLRPAPGFKRNWHFSEVVSDIPLRKTETSLDLHSPVSQAVKEPPSFDEEIPPEAAAFFQEHADQFIYNNEPEKLIELTSAETEVTDTILLDHLDLLTQELEELFQASTLHDKSTLLIIIDKLLAAFPQLNTPSLRNIINNAIIKDARETFDIHLTQTELDILWSNTIFKIH